MRYARRERRGDKGREGVEEGCPRDRGLEKDTRVRHSGECVRMNGQTFGHLRLLTHHHDALPELKDEGRRGSVGCLSGLTLEIKEKRVVLIYGYIFGRYEHA